MEALERRKTTIHDNPALRGPVASDGAGQVDMVACLLPTAKTKVPLSSDPPA